MVVDDDDDDDDDGDDYDYIAFAAAADNAVGEGVTGLWWPI